MRIKHLKENEIQAYVEESLDRSRKEAEAHLNWCDDCAEAVEDYRAIFAALNADDIPDLQEGFADRVMARLKEQFALSPATKRWYDLSAETIISLTLGSLLGIMMTFYDSGASAFSKVYEILLLQTSQVFLNILGTVSSLIVKSGLRPEFMLFVGMLLLLFGILDKQLSRAKKRRINLHTL